MFKFSSSVTEAKHQNKQTITQVVDNPWIERLARLGYAAKGVLYLTIGILAIQVAFGLGGKVTDLKGALKTILTQPFGEYFLVGITVGLVGYAIWCLVQAIVAPECRGMTPQRLIQRLGYACGGLSYAGLAIAATKIITGLDNTEQNPVSVITAAQVLSQPFGRLLVILGGVMVIAVGCSYFYRAYAAKFCQRFKQEEMQPFELWGATVIGRLGLFARGSVYGVIGSFLIQSAIHYNPEQAKGFGGALKAIAQQPFGLFWLGVIAVGLVAYGVYELVLARYRQIGDW